MRTVVFALAGLLLPLPAIADCTPGSVPSYQDVRYVQIREFALGQPRPGFELEGAERPGSAWVRLKGYRSVPLVGTFAAAEPAALMESLKRVLERNRFFAMQLPVLAKCCAIDGPEDSISVARCGVGMTVGTLPPANGSFDDGSETQAFKTLEDQLRAVIFAAKWNPVPANPPE